MKNNVHSAVWIIAALSLFLGLSLGQNHRQYLEIQSLESSFNSGFAEDFNLEFEPMEFRINLNEKCREIHDLQAELRARRDELRAAREHLRAERERELRELHYHIDRIRSMRQH